MCSVNPLVISNFPPYHDLTKNTSATLLTRLRKDSILRRRGLCRHGRNYSPKSNKERKHDTVEARLTPGVPPRARGYDRLGTGKTGEDPTRSHDLCARHYYGPAHYQWRNPSLNRQLPSHGHHKRHHLHRQFPHHG